MAVSSAGRGERIVAEVTGWSGVTTRTGRFGETEFVVRGRGIGHVHGQGDGQADIPLPRKVHDEVVADGRAELHHVNPGSTWVTRYVHSDADVDGVVELLRINYDRVTRPR